MARRDRGFGWVREDQEEEAREPATRRDGGAERKLAARLERLANTLAALPPSAQARLPVPEHVRDAVAELAACGPTPARKRQVLHLVALLRDVDLEAVDAALAGDTPHARLLRDLERWRTRILEGDDAVVHAFVAEHPAADAQQLRQLARVARKPDAGAARRLFAALRQAAEASATP
ncbi:MAG: DUF615 domain-containing protein [Alphaproteobacteria bacterium]|nr:DUF615 domain-containing protein [Alphaproteobacteria bacterium]